MGKIQQREMPILDGCRHGWKRQGCKKANWGQDFRGIIAWIQTYYFYFDFCNPRIWIGIRLIMFSKRQEKRKQRIRSHEQIFVWLSGKSNWDGSHGQAGTWQGWSGKASPMPISPRARLHDQARSFNQNKWEESLPERFCGADDWVNRKPWIF